MCSYKKIVSNMLYCCKAQVYSCDWEYILLHDKYKILYSAHLTMVIVLSIQFLLL